MTEQANSPLRRRMIEDMSIRKFAAKTQHDYVQRVKDFATFLGRSPNTAEAEDVTPHDNLTASTPKSLSPVRSLLSRPQRGALQCCVHHPTTAPIVRYTRPRRSEKRLASVLQHHRTPPSQPRY